MNWQTFYDIVSIHRTWLRSTVFLASQIGKTIYISHSCTNGTWCECEQLACYNVVDTTTAPENDSVKVQRANSITYTCMKFVINLSIHACLTFCWMKRLWNGTTDKWRWGIYTLTHCRCIAVITGYYANLTRSGCRNIQSLLPYIYKIANILYSNYIYTVYFCNTSVHDCMSYSIAPGF